MHFIFRIILRRKILRYTLGAQSTPKEVFMEISNYMDFQFLIRFLEGLQKFLGDNCEIIVHDYRKGYDHTIVYAFNSQLSGRDVGGSPRGGMITQLGNDIDRSSIRSFPSIPARKTGFLSPAQRSSRTNITKLSDLSA